MPFSLSLRTWVILAIGGSFVILANMLSYVIIGRINVRVPESERVSYFWYGTEIRKKHKELYPVSKLVLLLDLCTAGAMLCFPLLIWSLDLWNK